LKEYEHAIELQPDAAEPLLAAVRLDVARKDLKKGSDRLDAAVAKKPENVVALNAKAELLASQGHTDEAVAAFNQAIEKAPQWWVPYRSLALVQFSAKKPDAAVEALQRGIEQTKGAPTLVGDLATLHERAGRVDEAIKVYEQALGRDPKSTLFANNLAMLIVTHKSDKQSLDRAGQLADMLANMTEPAFLDTRGWVKFKIGQAKDALPLLLQAVDKAPNAPVLRYHLAMVQLKSGDKESARKNLEAALGPGKPFEGIDDARAALDEVKRS
jgi:tetratricopeptide (TPR) repeat protein